jgi:Secretory lipase
LGEDVPAVRLKRFAVATGSLLLAASAALGPVSPAGAAMAPPNAADSVLPSYSAFYAYKGLTPLRDIAPGTVLKKRTITVTIDDNDLPFKADQLLYRTTGQLGQPTVAVTTLIRPIVPVGTKIVAYQEAYDALGSECDPSYTLAGGNPADGTGGDEAAVMALYLTAGYYVDVSDYEGTNNDFVAGQESGYGTLDSIRASERDLGAPASTDVGLVGYSGGSIASEWASELAPTYSPGLHIVGVAEGGIPVDLAHNLNYVNGSPAWSGVIPAVVLSLARAFDVNLTPYLSAYGEQITQQVQGECIESFLGAYPGLRVQQLLKPQYQDFLAIPVFRKIVNTLLMGSVGGRPAGPLFMGVGDADGTGDGVMVTEDVEGLAHDYCTRGVNVQFNIYRSQDHDNAAIPFEVEAAAFLEQRFLGIPAINGCSTIGTGNSLAPLS